MFELDKKNKFQKVRGNKIIKQESFFMKQNVLTEVEYNNYKKFERILKYVEILRKKLRIEREEFNILDWGCGRGESVIWLKDTGYNAFGVEVNSNYIKNCYYLLKKKGYNKSILNLIDNDGKTKFSDEQFHFIFSKQVFEHVNNLKVVISEISRITKKNCLGYHTFSAKRRLIEGHLKMPLINQIKNHNIIKLIIYFFVTLGIHPHWKELKGYNIKRKVDIYLQYLQNKVYYRSYEMIANFFRKFNFKVYFDIIYFRRFRNTFKFLNSIINFIILNFVQVNLLSIKL